MQPKPSTSLRRPSVAPHPPCKHAKRPGAYGVVNRPKTLDSSLSGDEGDGPEIRRSRPAWSERRPDVEAGAEAAFLNAVPDVAGGDGELQHPDLKSGQVSADPPLVEEVVAEEGDLRTEEGPVEERETALEASVVGAVVGRIGAIGGDHGGQHRFNAHGGPDDRIGRIGNR